MVTHAVYTHPDGNLGTEFNILGFLLPPSGRNPTEGDASVHVEFAGVDLEGFVLSPCQGLCIKQGAVT